MSVLPAIKDTESLTQKTVIYVRNYYSVKFDPFYIILYPNSFANANYIDFLLDVACFREEREVLVRGNTEWITSLHYAFQAL